MRLPVFVLLLVLLPACGKKAETHVERATRSCRTHYDILMRWVTGHGRLPETDEDLARAAQIRGPDPWGGRYVIETEGQVRIWSKGPDREPETEDDIAYPPFD